MPIEPMRRWNMEPCAAGPPATRKRLHDALEAFALGDADDVDELAFGEGGDGDDVADLERGAPR